MAQWSDVEENCFKNVKNSTRMTRMLRIFAEKNEIKNLNNKRHPRKSPELVEGSGIHLHIETKEWITSKRLRE